MNIAIVGFGSQGVSALKYWQNDENNITVCDKQTVLDLPEGVHAKIGIDYLEGLEGYDLIVRSPSVHPKDLAHIAPEKITSNTNEFLRVCPSQNIIGVTGTKGKGTTSSLIAKMLEAAGNRVHLGGNIGTPPLEMLKGNIQPEDWVVLELANFQTMDIKYSPRIAVCLMVVPEHLDWHTDYEEYKSAKKQLFVHQSEDDIVVYFAENEASKEITGVSHAKKIGYYSDQGAHIEGSNIVIDGKVICRTNEVRLLGDHNLQNVCAAVTAIWNITQDIEAIHSVISTFTGLEHRLEFVREVNGVQYYNDSFGTTPETAIVAIDSFKEPKIIILGGSNKGASYDELAKKVTGNNVKHIVAIGDTAEAILAAIDQQENGKSIARTHLAGQVSMDEIITSAKSKAEPGDVVLLSTACASFGLFKDYKDRGDKFKRAVQALD